MHKRLTFVNWILLSGSAPESTSATFIDLPREIVNEFGHYSDTATQLSLMRTCNHAHGVVSRLLYRNIKTKSHRARRLFVTILSNSKSAVHYPSFIKSLEYSAAIPSDAYLTFPLLAAVLITLPNLRNLSLLIPSSMTEFLIYLLTRNGVIRQPSSVFRHIRAITDSVPSITPLNLSSLNSLSIDSHLSLVAIARCRPLKELIIHEPVDLSDLDFISECLTGQPGSSHHLKSLTVTVDVESTAEITFSLLGLAATFPVLEKLVFRAAHINAMAISNLLAQHQSIFCAVHTLKFNPDIFSSVASMMPDDKILFQQKLHLSCASKSRPKLESVQFGNMVWTISQPNNEWKTEREENNLARYGFRSWLCSSPYCVYYETLTDSDEDEE